MDPFLGEIRLFPWDFAPKSWVLCQGQTMPINQNQALFSLLGTFYGGNGSTTFNLPDLRGRAPVGSGGGAVGSMLGSEQVALTIATIPSHTHALNTSSGVAAFQRPGGLMLGVDNTMTPTGVNFYGNPTNLTTLAPTSIVPTGGTAPHENMQPYLVMNYCIALAGVFPSRN